VSFEPLLACHATKMIGFTVVRDLKLGCLFVQNNAANRIFWHYFTLNLIERVDLLLIMISGERINNEKVRKRILGNEVKMSAYKLNIFSVVFVWHNILGSILVCFHLA
jgi:hypothetical protein